MMRLFARLGFSPIVIFETSTHLQAGTCLPFWGRKFHRAAFNHFWKPRVENFDPLDYVDDARESNGSKSIIREETETSQHSSNNSKSTHPLKVDSSTINHHESSASYDHSVNVLTPNIASLISNLRSSSILHNQTVEAGNSVHVAEGVSFQDFDLQPNLLNKLKSLNFKVPFEIQARTLNALLEGKNVIGQAVTGSGKTLAFAIPVVDVLARSSLERKFNSEGSPLLPALVMTPTRELCMQVTNSIQQLNPNLKCLSLYGGVSITRDLQRLSSGVDVICATPGRLRDHINRGSLSLEQLKFLVLDEADEMLKDDFRADLEDILRYSPDDKQVMLFSATIPAELYEISQKFLKRELEVISIIPEKDNANAPENIQHLFLTAKRGDFTPAVIDLINIYEPKSTIIFVNTRRLTQSLGTELRYRGVKNPQQLMGGMSQTTRETVINGFKRGKFNVLVATDVAARGIDVPDVEMIVQIGLPQGSASYLHRSGRTGRAGKAGLSVMIHSGSSQEKEFVNNMKRKVKNSVEEIISRERNWEYSATYGDSFTRRKEHRGPRRGEWDNYRQTSFNGGSGWKDKNYFNGQKFDNRNSSENFEKQNSDSSWKNFLSWKNKSR